MLRPLSRFIDRRSLAMVNPHALYRLRLVCDTGLQDEAERQLTRAIAERSLMLRELRAEPIRDTETSLVQTVVESSTRDEAMVRALLAELRDSNSVESADVMTADNELE